MKNDPKLTTTNENGSDQPVSSGKYHSDQNESDDHVFIPLARL